MHFFSFRLLCVQCSLACVVDSEPIFCLSMTFYFLLIFSVISSQNDRRVLIAFLQCKCSFRYKVTWKHQRQLCEFEYNHFKTKFQKITSCSVCRRFPIEIYVRLLSNHIQQFEKVIYRWLPKFEYSVLAILHALVFNYLHICARISSLFLWQKTLFECSTVVVGACLTKKYRILEIWNQCLKIDPISSHFSRKPHKKNKECFYTNFALSCGEKDTHFMSVRFLRMCLTLLALKKDFWFAFRKNLRMFAQIEKWIVSTRNNAKTSNWALRVIYFAKR